MSCSKNSFLIEKKKTEMGILVYKVSKLLGDSKRFDRVSFYVPAFLMAIMSPSGSGNSSLLRVIAGLYDCKHRRIWLHGLKEIFLHNIEK